MSYEARKSAEAAAAREWTADISQPDDDGFCQVKILEGGELFETHSIRSDQVDQWTSQELGCLREWSGR